MKGGGGLVRSTGKGRGGGVNGRQVLWNRFCATFLCAVGAVVSKRLRLPSGVHREMNGNRPLLLTSSCCRLCVIRSLVVTKWHEFCRAGICRLGFSWTWNAPLSGRAETDMMKFRRGRELGPGEFRNGTMRHNQTCAKTCHGI